MNIAMLYQNNPPFTLSSHDQTGIGGSENGFLRTIRWLAKLGHRVEVYNRAPVSFHQADANIWWGNIDAFDRSRPFDVACSLRHREPFKAPINARLKVLFTADTESIGLGEDVHNGLIDLVMFVSHWQKEKITREEGLPEEYCYITSNGIEESPQELPEEKVPGRCLFMSTPDRGLESLLNLWPDIRMRVPYATLHLYSSYLGWGVSSEENENMIGELYKRINDMSHIGVVNMRHANAWDARKAQLEADAYLYPSDFYETCCMAVLESMYCGAIPVVTGRAALLEKVLTDITGYMVSPVGSNSPRYKRQFVESVTLALTLPIEEKNRIRDNCRRFASQFTYGKLVPAWAEEWQMRVSAKG